MCRRLRTESDKQLVTYFFSIHIMVDGYPFTPTIDQNRLFLAKIDADKRQI